MVDMTPDALKAITKEMKQYNTPALNDKLYLHFKGWKKIEECLGEYIGVRAMWLEGNGLRSIENLSNLKDLRCLYVQQNCLESLEGLEENIQLDAINASNNNIKTISNISHLKRLNTLQVSHNRLMDPSDIEALVDCSTIGVLDISNNKLEDPAVLDILARMENLHVLQMQGNPVTRKIQHYRKTVVARCQKLTYLDDRPVFEDERRTVTAWARGGAGHKVEANADGSPGELSAVAIAEALADGTFDKNAAHEAEKAERQLIRDEKDEKERRNREAFREMMLESRVRRIMQILPNMRLFKDIPEPVIEELAHRVVQNPVHTNEVIGLAKDECAVAAGSVLAGLYIITRGRLQMQRDGKPVSLTGGGKLASGQYFGEVSLCTAHDQVATADMVCTEYGEIYCLTKDALMEVAELYEGTLDTLQGNRAQALRCQWHECKPWRAYDLVPATRSYVDSSKGALYDDGERLLASQVGAEAAEGVRVDPRAAFRGNAAEWSEADQFVSELGEAQRSKPAFKPRPPEAHHNPPSAAFVSQPSVVSWFASRNPKVPLPTSVLSSPAPSSKTSATTETKEYPLEWYGKNELAKTLASCTPGNEDAGAGCGWDGEAFGSYHYYEKHGAQTGVRVAGCDDEYHAQHERVKAARAKAFAEEAARRGCSVEKVEAEADELVEKRRALREAGSTGADSEAHIHNDARRKLDEEAGDDLPPLEDVDVNELQEPSRRSAPLASMCVPTQTAPAQPKADDDDNDAPPDLEDVEVSSEAASGSTTRRGFYSDSDEEVLASAAAGGVQGACHSTATRQFKTQYEKDNDSTLGEYNRQLEAEGAYNRSFSSKTEETRASASIPSTDFEAAAKFTGSRKGYVFKMGDFGLGYYKDDKYGGATLATEETSPDIYVLGEEPCVKSTSRIEEIEEHSFAVSATPTYGDGGIDDLD